MRRRFNISRTLPLLAVAFLAAGTVVAGSSGSAAASAVAGEPIDSVAVEEVVEALPDTTFGGFEPDIDRGFSVSADTGEFAATASGQPVDNACSAFVNLPVNVLDILPRNVRIDMLTYFAADSIWQAPNSMEGLSHLETAGKDYLRVALTEVSDLQVRMLPYGKDRQIVMTIYTIGRGGQAPDSDVRFFDASLTELDRTKFFRYPQLKDYLDVPKGSLTSMKELTQMVAFPTYEFVTDAESTDLRGRLSVGEYMQTDDYNILKLYLRPGVTYLWNGKSYKAAK